MEQSQVGGYNHRPRGLSEHELLCAEVIDPALEGILHVIIQNDREAASQPENESITLALV